MLQLKYYSINRDKQTILGLLLKRGMADPRLMGGQPSN